MKNTKRTITGCRQGDTKIFPATKKVNFNNAEKLTTFTVALGSSTGHHHTIVPIVPGSIIKSAIVDGVRFIELDEDWLYDHQQHENIIISKGVYEIIPDELEYDPFEEEITRVQD